MRNNSNYSQKNISTNNITNKNQKIININKLNINNFKQTLQIKINKLNKSKSKIITNKYFTKNNKQLASNLNKHEDLNYLLVSRTNQSLISSLIKPDELSIQAQAQACSSNLIEINKLIKKLTLGFTASKNESSFFISDGVFEGARFKLNYNENNLRLSISNLKDSAHKLLVDHQEYLRLRLRQKEINLGILMFSS